MSAVVGRYRPSAAEVRPGTEPYERVIRALRGEPWNKGFGATRTEEQRPQRPPVYTSTPICIPIDIIRNGLETRGKIYTLTPILSSLRCANSLLTRY